MRLLLSTALLALISLTAEAQTTQAVNASAGTTFTAVTSQAEQGLADAQKLLADTKVGAASDVITADQKAVAADLTASLASAGTSLDKEILIGKKYRWDISPLVGLAGSLELPTTGGTVAGGGAVCLAMHNGFGLASAAAASDFTYIDLAFCQSVLTEGARSTGGSGLQLGLSFPVSKTFMGFAAGFSCLDGSLPGIHTHCLFSINLPVSFELPLKQIIGFLNL